MNISGTRFGSIEYTAEDVVSFDEGLIGFSKLCRHILVSTKEGSPFRWLQSLDEPSLAFLLTDPVAFVDGYAPAMTDAEAESLALCEDTPRLLYTTASIPAGCPNDMTLNLVAPIVINAVTRKAKQIVLDDHAYTIRHRVFPAADRTSEKKAA